MEDRRSDWKGGGPTSRAIFYGVPAHGHTNPTLGVVRELVAHGEEVVYYSSGEFRQRIEATGALFREYDRDMGKPSRSVAASGLALFSALLVEASLGTIERLLLELDSQQPDYVVFDSIAVWGKAIAELTRLPSVSSVTTFAIGGGNRRRRSAAGTVRMLLNRDARNGVLRFRWAVAQLSRRYGVHIQDMRDVYRLTGGINIVYTSRYFQPHAEDFDDSFKFVGPSIVPRSESVDFPVEALDGQRAVYVSLGTIFNHRVGFYRTCLEALSGMDVTAVLSVGPNTDAEALGPIPRNVLVRGYVPQLEVLQRSAVCVTHGGLNTVGEALYYGVPLVVVPQGVDQFVTAGRVEALGAGVRLDSSTLSAEGLRRAVERVLSDESFRQGSKAIGESFRAAGGYRRAAEEILSFRSLHRHHAA